MSGGPVSARGYERSNRFESLRAGTGSLIILIIFLALPALSVPPAGAAPAVTGTITRVVPDMIGILAQPGLAISGDRIVWACRDNTDDPGGTARIEMYTISAGNTRVISSSPAFDAARGTTQKSHPAISGDRIAWEENGNIHLYDLVRGNDSALPSPGPEVAIEPDLSGDRLVWAAQKAWAPNENGTTVMFRNLTSGREYRIGTGVAGETNPAIWRDVIVWEDRRNGNPDIYRFDLVNGTEEPVCTGTADQRHPDIDEGRIVWEDRRNGNGDILMFEISSGRETALSLGPADDTDPEISGDLVVWQRTTRGILAPSVSSTIVIHDLREGTERELPGGEGDRFGPVISGRRIAYAMAGDGGEAIELFTLAGGPFPDTPGPATEPGTGGGPVPYHGDEHRDPAVFPGFWALLAAAFIVLVFMRRR
jgi:TolB protein